MQAHQASLWCAHPRLLSGEAFSSWLHRCAFANGMADHTFCRHLFGSRPIWNRDIDRLADASLIATAAHAFGESVERLTAGTLRSYQGRLFPALAGGQTRWVLALGVYHRVRRRHGQQYCPHCLAEKAWAPLHWRFAFVIACSHHRCLLLDSCPRCDAPFMFHRMSLAQPTRLNCPMCRINLLQAPTASASQRQLRFQQQLLRSLKSGIFSLGSQAIPALAFFDGLRILARGTYSKYRLGGLQDTLPRAARKIAIRYPWQLLERARLPWRMQVLDILRRSLVDWPTNFIHETRRAGIYASRFADRRSGAPPGWLSEGLSGLVRR